MFFSKGFHPGKFSIAQSEYRVTQITFLGLFCLAVNILHLFRLMLIQMMIVSTFAPDMNKKNLNTSPKFNFENKLVLFLKTFDVATVLKMKK